MSDLRSRDLPGNGVCRFSIHLIDTTSQSIFLQRAPPIGNRGPTRNSIYSACIVITPAKQDQTKIKNHGNITCYLSRVSKKLHHCPAYCFFPRYTGFWASHSIHPHLPSPRPSPLPQSSPYQYRVQL